MQVLTWLGCHLQCITRGREPPLSLLACSLTIPFPHPNTSILICTSQAAAQSQRSPASCSSHVVERMTGHQPWPLDSQQMDTQHRPGHQCHCLCVGCLYLGNHLPGEWWPVSVSARTTHTPQSGCCSHARCPQHPPQPYRSLPSVKSRAGSCGSQAIPVSPQGLQGRHNTGPQL